MRQHRKKREPRKTLSSNNSIEFVAGSNKKTFKYSRRNVATPSRLLTERTFVIHVATSCRDPEN